MAVTVVSHSVTASGSQANSEDVSFSCAGTNRLLLVAIATFGGVLPSGATYNSVAMTQVLQITAALSGQSSRSLTVYRLIAPASGSNTLHTTYGAGTSSHGIFAMCLSGVDQTTPLGTANTSTVNATTASTTVSAATGDVVVSGVHVRATTTPSATGSGQVILDPAVVNSPNALAAVATQDGAASVTSSWSWGASADNGAAFSVPVKWDGTTVPSAFTPRLRVATRAVSRAAVI